MGNAKKAPPRRLGILGRIQWQTHASRHLNRGISIFRLGVLTLSQVDESGGPFWQIRIFPSVSSLRRSARLTGYRLGASGAQVDRVVDGLSAAGLDDSQVMEALPSVLASSAVSGTSPDHALDLLVKVAGKDDQGEPA